MSVAVIVNPISGAGGRKDIARARVELASTLLRASGSDGDVAISEYPGHARDLAEAALARGATIVVAWGGDGTVNEIASVLTFRNATLGIIPSGSGNGLARELGIPLQPAAALRVVVGGRDRTIDCGEIDGRPFFNIAGLGLDARVSREFAAHGLVRRGFRRYLEIAARELFTFKGDEHTIVVDTGSIQRTALLVAIANGRQYGNGAVIAPDARIDDGRLDVVVVAARHPVRALLEAPLLFVGQASRMPGVITMRSTTVEITSSRSMLFHVDGEPHLGPASLVARVRPGALRVRVPVR